ncbi:MAG: ABC transporter ATP-binding protein, partial [Sphaerochaetaceae bacterium]|nr:ABC transporter ATP-binding protein [Sphaerochaetaceae bacterium]
MKKHLGQVILVMLIKTAATFTELLLPYVLEYMIDDIAPLKNPKLIIIWGLVMLALALAVRFVSVNANRGAVKIAKKCIYSIRQDLFSKTINLSGDQSDEIGLPSLISRMTSDSYNLQSFIQTFQTLGIRAPILLLGG